VNLLHLQRDHRGFAGHFITAHRPVGGRDIADRVAVMYLGHIRGARRSMALWYHRCAGGSSPLHPGVKRERILVGDVPSPG
jgi:hypothetical protein